MALLRMLDEAETERIARATGLNLLYAFHIVGDDGHRTIELVEMGDRRHYIYDAKKRRARPVDRIRHRRYCPKYHDALGIDENEAPVRHDAPETSHKAAARALPRSGSKKREVYELIKERGKRGHTAEEVGLQFDWEHQTYSAAVSNLAKDGHLIDSGKRRKTRAGNDAIVWVIAED